VPDATTQNRRRFLRQAAGLAGALTAARAQTTASASFGPMKPIEAGLLGVGYAEAGPADSKYSHRVLKGIGHNVPQEAPQAFAKAVIDVDRD
jgi:hypothetical protein